MTLENLLTIKKVRPFLADEVKAWSIRLPKHESERYADMLKDGEDPQIIAVALTNLYKKAQQPSATPPPAPAPQAAPQAPRHASRAKPKTGFKIKMPKAIVLFAAGTVLLLVFIVFVVIANKPETVPIGAGATIPQSPAAAPEAAAEAADAEAAAEAAAAEDAKEILAPPKMPESRQSIAFGSSPYKGVEQWVQLASLIGLVSTILIDAGMRGKIATERSNRSGTLSGLTFFVGPLASIMGVVSFILADTLLKEVSPETRYNIAGIVGSILILLGWFTTGGDRSHLGSILALLGMVMLIFPSSAMPFGIESTPEVYKLKDVFSAMSLNQWTIAARSIGFYLLLISGAILIVINMLRGENTGAINPWGFVTASVITFSLFLLNRFTHSAWGIVAILVVFVVNIALDPDGADEGAALGIIAGTLLLVAFGTPLV
jgi:hypothetical protein